MKIEKINKELVDDLEARGYTVNAQHFRFLQRDVKNVYCLSPKLDKMVGDLVEITKEMYNQNCIHDLIQLNSHGCEKLTDCTDQFNSIFTTVCSYGGQTDLIIMDKESKKIISAATSRCSKKDLFKKSRGFNIALGRAIKLAKL